MESYTRRNKVILPLIGVMVFLSGCCSRFYKIPPPIPVVKIADSLIRPYKKDLIVTLVKEYNPSDSNETKFSEKIYKDDFDSLINKTTHQKISKEEYYFVISIRDFIKDYKIKNGYLIINGDSNENSMIDVIRYEDSENITLANLKNAEFTSVEKILKTKDGEIDFAQGIVYKQSNINYLYDNMLNIYIKTKENNTIKYEMDNEYSPLRVFFNEGNGILKKYYYIKSNSEYIRGHIREEGEVKNNFKFGEWKYYNKDGKIDSIKTYTLRDSVDVRFPHCIFNKNEPCY